MLNLTGKVAIVTGAGSVGPGWGNGRATAVLLARQGASVFLVDVVKDAVEQTRQTIEDEGFVCATHLCDMLDSAAVKKMVPTLDVRPGLSKIQCPTLVITTTGSGLGTVQDTESWCELIKTSTMLVLEDDSYHVAAVKVEESAQATLRFVTQHSTL